MRDHDSLVVCKYERFEILFCKPVGHLIQGRTISEVQ